MPPVSLDALVDSAAFLSHEHQLHLADLAEQLGEHRFQADLETQTLELVGDRVLRTTVSLLGSTGDRVGTWLWGWANPGFRPEVVALGAQVAEFGRRYGLSELAEPEHPLTPDLGSRLTDATKLITGHWTGYSAQAGPGTRAYFLIDAPELALPAASLPRCLRVLGEVLSMGTVQDHRRALSSYVRLRGLVADAAADRGSVTVRLPDGQVTVAFDAQGRIAEMSGQTGANQR